MAVRHLSVNQRNLEPIEWPTNWPESKYSNPSWSDTLKSYDTRIYRIGVQCRLNMKALEETNTSK